MSTYQVVLFLHVIAVILAFASSGILHLAMVEMRSARSVSEVRIWARLQRRFGRAMPGAVVLLFGTGAYLVHDMWRWDAAWVEASVAGLVALTLLGGVAGARADRAVDAALAGAGEDSPTPALTRAVRRPEAWVASHVCTMLALAVVWMMVRKPEVRECLAALGVAVLVGAASALPLCRVPEDAPLPKPAGPGQAPGVAAERGGPGG